MCSSRRDICKSECRFVGSPRPKINTAANRRLLSLAGAGRYVRLQDIIPERVLLTDRPLKRQRLQPLSGSQRKFWGTFFKHFQTQLLNSEDMQRHRQQQKKRYFREILSRGFVKHRKVRGVFQRPAVAQMIVPLLSVPLCCVPATLEVRYEPSNQVPSALPQISGRDLHSEFSSGASLFPSIS